MRRNRVAQHVQSYKRQAINAQSLRGLALSAYCFREPASSCVITDHPRNPVLVADETVVKVTHLNELRDAIEDAFVAIGIPALSFANPTLTPGSSNVYAIDIQELRNALK